MDTSTEASKPTTSKSGSQYGTFDKPLSTSPNSSFDKSGPPSKSKSNSEEQEVTSEVPNPSEPSFLVTFHSYIAPYTGETWFNIVLISLPVLITYVFTYFGIGLGGSLFLAYFVAKLFQDSLTDTYSRKVQKIQNQLTIPELENDLESVRWINQFLAGFWLQFEPQLSQQIASGVEAGLVENLPAFITSAKFMSFTLGTKAPLVENVKFYPREESDIIIMDWTVSFTPYAHHSGVDPAAAQPNLNPLIALDVVMALGPIKMTLPIVASHTRFRACLRIKMRLMNAFPHIKAIDVALLEMPEIDLSLRPIAPLGWDLTNIPGFWGLVNRQIYLIISGMMLAPKVYTVDVESMMAGGADLDSAIGVIKLTLVSARNLKNVELLGMIDPFVSVNIEGRKELVRTKTIDNTREPVWDETFTILVYNIAETLNLLVKDQNGMKKDHTLGTCSLNLSSLLEEPEQEHCAKLNQNGKSRGDLTYRISYFPVAEALKLEDGTEEPVQSNSGILKLFIREVSGLEKQKRLLPVGSKSKVWVEVQNNAKSLVTTPSVAMSNRIVIESVTEHFIDSLTDSSLRVSVQTSQSSLGTVTIPLESFLNPENGIGKEGWYDVHASGTGSGSGNPLRIKFDGKWAPVLMDADSNGALPLPFGFARVVVRQAKDLKSGDLVGKAGPSVMVVMSNKVWGRTPPQENSSNPVWESVFYVPIHRSKETLCFEVKGSTTLKARNFGQIDLPLSELLGSPYSSKQGYEDGDLKEGWYNLKDKSRGSVQLSAQFFSIFPDALPLKADSNSPPATGKESPVEASEVSETTELAESPKETEPALPPIDLTQFNSGILRVTAVEARGVGSSRSKLYALVLLNGDERNPVLQTRVFKGSNAPVWGETGEGFVKEVDVDRLSVTIREARDGEDKIIGTWESKLDKIVQELSAAALEPTLIQNEGTWYNFEGNIGSIQLKFHFSPTQYQIDPVESARNRGVLQARVVQADDLMAADKDGSSDPYVTLSVNQSDKVKTKTRKNDLNPKYDQLFSFKVLDRIHSVLHVEVFDWNQIHSHKSLGSIDIDLAELEVESLVKQTFPLTNASSGSVSLELLFAPMYVFNEVSSGLLDAALSGNPVDLVGGLAKGGFSLAKGTGKFALGGAASLASGSAHLAGGAISTTGKFAVGGAKLAGHGAKTVLSAPLKLASSGAGVAKGLFGKKDKQPTESMSPPVSSTNQSLEPPSAGSSRIHSPFSDAAVLPGSGNLVITLIEAKNLKAVDRNGSSDPYVKVSRDGKTLLKTKVIKKTCDPTWDEQCVIPSAQHGEPLEIRVHIKDHNTFGGDVDLGDYILNPWEHLPDPTSGSPMVADFWTPQGSIQNGELGILHFKLEFHSASRALSISSGGIGSNTDLSLHPPGAGGVHKADSRESDNDSNPISASNSYEDRRSINHKSNKFFGSLRKKIGRS